MRQHTGSLDKKTNLELWRVYFCSAQEKYAYVTHTSSKGALRASIILSWDLLSTVDLQKASDIKELHQYTVRQTILHYRTVASVVGEPTQKNFFF